MRISLIDAKLFVCVLFVGLINEGADMKVGLFDVPHVFVPGLLTADGTDCDGSRETHPVPAGARPREFGKEWRCYPLSHFEHECHEWT